MLWQTRRGRGRGQDVWEGGGRGVNLEKRDRVMEVRGMGSRNKTAYFV